MLTIEAHRLVIGRFCAKAIILSSQGVVSKKQQGKNFHRLVCRNHSAILL